jgi:hypothetical protein
MTRPVNLWDVYHLWVHQMQPNAKHKFVIAIHILDESSFLGVVINSELNTYQLKRPDLFPCFVPIPEALHPGFLKHNSFVDCREAYTFLISEISADDFRGVVHFDSRDGIKNGALSCPVLSIKKQKLIGS